MKRVARMNQWAATLSGVSVLCLSLRMFIPCLVLLMASGVFSASPASAQATPTVAVFTTGARFQCMHFLELERVQIPGTSRFLFYPTEPDLSYDYLKTIGWLSGYMSGLNMHRVIRSDGQLGVETDISQWMAWLFSYCRAHPGDKLNGAASALALALAGQSPQR